MKITLLFLTCSFFGVVLHGAESAINTDDTTISELRSLVAISPTKRTKDQKERIRDIWRTSEKLRDFFHGSSVLQIGDSVFDFPGVIQGKDIQYDGIKREYHLKDAYSVESADGGKDHWVIDITFSEDGIVTDRQHLKMNSR
jgi:hypothetical protein